MSEELKPCPFCGGGAVYISEVKSGFWPGSAAFVQCSQCGIRTAGHWENPPGAGSVNDWNRRAVNIEEVVKVAEEMGDGDLHTGCLEDWSARLLKAVGREG